MLDATVEFLSHQSHFEATQVNIEDYFCYKDDSSAVKDDIKTQTVPDPGKDFLFPSFIPPDDENDDFSWLFKVLPCDPPHSDQTVPSEAHLFEEKVVGPIIKASENDVPPAPLEQSMLMDPMFSLMDITSLIAQDDSPDEGDDKITFHKADVNNDDNQTPSTATTQEVMGTNLRRSSRVKRPTRSQTRAPAIIIDTPVSLRRSQRKRSYKQMMNEEVVAHDLGNNSVPNKKRRKTQRSSTDTSAWSVHTPLSEKGENVNGKSGLKLIFRKHKPVNPVDRRLVSNKQYQKGLIDSSKSLVAELYLSRTLENKSVPVVEEGISSILPLNPLNVKEIEDTLKLEWIENHNAIAYAKAHVIKRELTEDTQAGNAEEYSSGFMNVEKEYDNLLQIQNSALSVMNYKVATMKSSREETEDNTNESFAENVHIMNSHLEKVTGAVPVNITAISNSDSFVKNWTTFQYKGHLYRPNPAVVVLQRITDDLIEDMQSKPRKIALHSEFYNALTSYFDTNHPNETG